MRSWKRSLSLFGAAVLSLVLLTPQGAEASRRSALHGNLLIEDVTDIYLMPQLLSRYRNLIRVQMGTDTSTGDGLLIFGDDSMSFGLAAHRSDNLDPLSGVRVPASASASLLNGAMAPDFFGGLGGTPGTLVDAFLSLNMGEAAALGFRLGFGNGGSSTGDTGVGITTLLLEGGYSMFGDTRVDLSLFIALALASDDTGGGDSSGTQGNIGVQGRVYLPMADQVELGVLGNLGVGFGSVDQGGDGPSFFNLNAAVGAGPAYKLERARIAAYGFLAFDFRSDTASSDAESSSDTNITIPGVHMALEVDLVEWFHFRAGLEAAWAIDSSSPPGDGDGSSERGAQFGWSTGFGLTFDRFKADFALADSFWTRGPNFISGNSGSFGASVSASYTF